MIFGAAYSTLALFVFLPCLKNSLQIFDSIQFSTPPLLIMVGRVTGGPIQFVIKDFNLLLTLHVSCSTVAKCEVDYFPISRV